MHNNSTTDQHLTTFSDLECRFFLNYIFIVNFKQFGGTFTVPRPKYVSYSKKILKKLQDSKKNWSKINHVKK